MKKLFSIIIMVIIIIPTSAVSIGAEWGTKPKDLSIYWLDKLYSSTTGNSNLAALLTDANRTSFVVIEYKNSDYLNYSLGLANGTNMLYNQSIVMSHNSINGVDLILPTGALPLVLPLSITDHSDYFEYLDATSNALGGIINNMFNLASNESTLTVSSDYSEALTISANIHAQNLTSISIPEITGFNFTNLNQFGNVTLNNISLDVNLKYNSTDGYLDNFYAFYSGDLKVNINNTIISTGSQNGSITLLRTEFHPYVEPSKWQFSPWYLLLLGVIALIIPIIKKYKK